MAVPGGTGLGGQRSPRGVSAVPRGWQGTRLARESRGAGRASLGMAGSCWGHLCCGHLWLCPPLAEAICGCVQLWLCSHLAVAISFCSPLAVAISAVVISDTSISVCVHLWLCPPLAESLGPLLWMTPWVIFGLPESEAAEEPLGHCWVAPGGHRQVVTVHFSRLGPHW